LRERAAGAREPYRVVLRGVRARLVATRAWTEASLDSDHDVTPDAAVYLDAEDLIEVLQLCRRSLEATGNGLVADGRLTDVLRRLAAFGVTLARLDIRQEAARHTAALAAVTGARGLESYADWDEPARVEFLLREVAGNRPLLPAALEMPPAVRDVVETFRAIATIPPGSLGAYVISMTRPRGFAEPA
jgi:phosphoenolpyruvate carboxylase